MLVQGVDRDLQAYVIFSTGFLARPIGMYNAIGH